MQPSPNRSKNAESSPGRSLQAGIILASASPRRAALLRELGLEFEIVASDVEEVHSSQLTGSETTQINAFRKAQSLALKYPDHLIIGADTLVCLDSVLYGKPRDLEDARRMLRELQGRTHLVITGVCLMRAASETIRLFAEVTCVQFRKLNEAQIRSYLNSMNPLDKAGAYAIQEGGDVLVEKISGSFSNVVGLPWNRLRQELERGKWFS